MTDTQERIERDFYARDPEEQRDFLTNTWCNECQEVDLGMTDPEEYEFMHRIFVDGKCVRCGTVTTTEIIEDEGEIE